MGKTKKQKHGNMEQPLFSFSVPALNKEKGSSVQQDAAVRNTVAVGIIQPGVIHSAIPLVGVFLRPEVAGYDASPHPL